MLSVYKKFKPYLLGVIIGLSVCCIGLFFYLNHSFTPHDIWNDLASGEIVKKLPKPYVVYSGSMEPAIKTAGVIFTLPQNTYFPGDVVTFALNDDNENLVTHRVEHKKYPNGIYEEPIYLTSGDANEDFDKWEVTNEQITGKVFFHIPYLGYAVDFAKKPQGFILFVIIPATIIVYEELKFLADKFRKLTLKLKQKLTRPSRVAPCKVTPFEPKKTKNGVPKISVLIPTAGALVVLIAVSAGFFMDSEISLDNVLGVAESYGELPTPTSEPLPTPTPTPTVNIADHVVINELMIHPEGSPDWLELFNPTQETINLTGWTIKDLANNTITLSGSINSESYLSYDWSNRLNNGGDTVYLYNGSENVDVYEYHSDPGVNVSVGRDPDATEGFNSCTSATKDSSNTGNCL